MASPLRERGHLDDAVAILRTYANAGSASATSLLVDTLRQRDDLDQAIAVPNRAIDGHQDDHGWLAIQLADISPNAATTTGR